MSKPELRFPEFNDEWNKKKLSEISANPSYGMNSAAKDYDGKNKYIRITDIDEKSNKFIPNPLCSPDDNLDKNFLLKDNDLLFARTGASTGKSYLYNNNDGKLYFAGFLIKFNITNANSKFIFYNTLREEYKNWVKVTSVRSGQPGINANEYKNYELKLPSLKEQEKIVFFLSHVDKKIDLLETKKELLQTYKKGMLQQLFSQNLRFKDDAGNCYPNWNHLNFDKIFKSISTRKYQIKSSEILDIGKIAVIDQGKEKIAGYSNETLKKFVDIPVIVYGDHTTNLKYAENEFIVGADGIKLLKSKIESNLKYLFYCLYYFNIEPEGYKRHFNILRNVNLPLPFLSEQIKIADFLTSIDKKIDYVDKELQIDREFKKGLLERMFC